MTDNKALYSRLLYERCRKKKKGKKKMFNTPEINNHGNTYSWYYNGAGRFHYSNNVYIFLKKINTCNFSLNYQVWTKLKIVIFA